MTRARREQRDDETFDIGEDTGSPVSADYTSPNRFTGTIKKVVIDKRPYTDLVYQPMIELLADLRENGFKTFIVSGGGVEFMRVFAERVYGIPPEQVVGSSGALKFEYGPDGTPALRRLANIDFVDDKAGKPVGIQRFIGRRPIFAFGNSDGDKEMLEWTAAGARPHFAALVHHTDAEREYAYDRRSPIGRLDKAWDEAVAKGWTVVDMKNDWKHVFAFE